MEKEAGMAAGCVHPHGYLRISIDYRLYNAQRIAWLFINGKWPSKNIDHIDGNRSNNKASNLRECNHVQNAANRKISISNTSGFKGVSQIKSTGKWAAFIKINGKSKNLGTFKTPEEAHEAYKSAADRLHGVFAKH